MGEKKASLILLLILCFALVSIGNLKIVRATSIDYIRFSSGVTIFSPLNTTYNSRFLNLNMTFDQGAGIACSLNYSIDGNSRGSIPLVSEDTGFHFIFKNTGLVTLPELSEGSHYLTINVLCGLYDYHGAPPGAPFTPTFPGSSDYIATWTHTIHFKIDTFLVNPDVNWVEVTTLTGVGGIGSTDSFTVDHVDWRIRWEIEPGNGSQRKSFLVYIFPVTGIKGSEPWFESIQHFGIEETTGILNIYNHSGSFYMDVLASIDSYTLIIEQNIDSIPEFPSWIILPLFLVVTFVAVLAKKRLFHSSI